VLRRRKRKKRKKEGELHPLQWGAPFHDFPSVARGKEDQLTEKRGIPSFFWPRGNVSCCTSIRRSPSRKGGEKRKRPDAFYHLTEGGKKGKTQQSHADEQRSEMPPLRPKTFLKRPDAPPSKGGKKEGGGTDKYYPP